jgi:hypothetical protein
MIGDIDIVANGCVVEEENIAGKYCQ